MAIAAQVSNQATEIFVLFIMHLRIPYGAKNINRRLANMSSKVTNTSRR